MRNRRVLGGIALVVLTAAAGLFSLIALGDGADRDSGHGVRIDEVEAQSPKRSAIGPRPEEAETLATPDGVNRNREATLDPHSNSSTGTLPLRIRAVASDGRPLPNVEVEIVRAEPWPDRARPAPHESSVGRRLGFNPIGASSTDSTDSQGIAHFAWPGGAVFARCSVAVGTHGLHGERFVPANVIATGQVIELKLTDDPPLRVRLIDAGGAPVAGHGIRILSDRMRQRPLAWAMTDENGRALFRDWVEFATGEDGDPTAALIAAHLPQRANIDEAASFAVRLPRPDDAQDEIELQLPATGTIVVRWKGADSGRDDRPTTFTLVGSTRAYQPRRATGRGEATFHHVPLRRKFDIHARSDSGVSARAKCRGPERARETIVCELEPIEPVRTVARLVNPSGEPLAHAALTVATLSRSVEAVADSDGRVSLFEPGPYSGIARGAQWTARAGSRKFSSLRSGTSALVTGTRDAGDVVLAPTELILAGTLVDESRTPLGLTDFVLTACRDDERGRSLFTVDGKRHLRWSGRTDARGDFQVQGATHGDSIHAGLKDAIVRVSVKRADFMDHHLFGRAPFGSENQTVQCERPGRVVVLFDPTGDLTSPDLVWKLRASGDESTPIWSPERPEAGHVVFPRVMPGNFDLTAYFRDDRANVLSDPPAIEVQSGGTTTVGPLSAR